MLELQSVDPTASTTVRDVDAGDRSARRGLAVRAARCRRARGARGSPTSARAPAGPGLALAAALPGRARVAGRERGRGTAATSSGAVEVARAGERDRRQRAGRGVGRGAVDVVTARALAALPVLLEYAAPLLVEGGHVVAWKGAVRQEEAAAGARRGARSSGWPPAEVHRSSRTRARATTRCTCSARSRPRRSGSRAAPGWRSNARSVRRSRAGAGVSRETRRSDRRRR